MLAAEMVAAAKIYVEMIKYCRFLYIKYIYAIFLMSSLLVFFNRVFLLVFFFLTCVLNVLKKNHDCVFCAGLQVAVKGSRNAKFD